MWWLAIAGRWNREKLPFFKEYGALMEENSVVFSGVFEWFKKFCTQFQN
jgi:hypothetical protein